MYLLLYPANPNPSPNPYPTPNPSAFNSVVLKQVRLFLIKSDCGRDYLRFVVFLNENGSVLERASSPKHFTL